MRATAIEPWKDVRKQLMSKWYDIRVFEEPCPYYMSIPTPFCHFSNVLPEEQEEIIFNELKVFLLGNQTENIRISEMDEHNLPAAIGVNISFDPYIRSELERFNDILIATATIKKCCYAITHDAVKFSPIGGTVASTIDRKVSDAVLNICNKLDGLIDASQQLNTLFREVHGINESLIFYSDIVKTIYVEQLIGGQVLTLLDMKRRHVFAGQAMQDLDDVFQAGWKIFAQYIGGLVCRFEADNLQYEFVIWSSKEMNEVQQKMMNVNKSNNSSKSKRYVIVDSLCPKFFTKYLDILVRCAEFGDASKTENSNGKSKKETGETKESVESVMEDVRNVDWSNLDVQTTVRMLVQFSRKESVCLLREITSATNVDQAIRDIHELLLKGSCAHEVVVQCIKADILQKPIDEVGKIRLKKLTHDILGVAAEKHHPFWKYFSFKIEKANVFEMLGERMAQRRSSDTVLQNTVPTFFECISVSMACPIDVEPIISKPAVFHLVPIFRIWIQLHVASWRIANSRDELRGMMPSRSGSELALKKHLMNALDWEVANLKQKWAAYVDVAISLYYSKIAKAVSLDEYTECQQILANDVTKMMGITEIVQLENIKDILNLIWNYDNDEIRLPDLIADFEEVQSRFRMGAATLA